MNYDHAFHAGNHADVLKHLVLVAVLEALARKPAPYFVLDTHAGQGRYRLQAEAAQRSGEARDGIERLQARLGKISTLAPALAAYMAAIASELSLGAYPGSPLLIAQALRPQDHLACCEIKPETAHTLKKNLARDARIAVHQRDGYKAIKALLPPALKCGLVLIDPPYEAQLAEFDAVLAALGTGLARWPQAIFAVWYPIKQRRDVMPFLRAAEGLPCKSSFTVELRSQAEDSPLRLTGSGMLLINPPWQLDQVLEAALPQLAEALFGRQDFWLLQPLRQEFPA
ncbi:MAG: 23S rRNA (adenine(2030)-N(6))-methyltransferase RlmJ [Xanthomonadales bacterium]|nr:23S rRNA (adenine(2030)-N(6))-methyltransferase RlmJ [Xanthomonadales bacterium]